MINAQQIFEQRRLQVRQHNAGEKTTAQPVFQMREKPTPIAAPAVPVVSANLSAGKNIRVLGGIINFE